MFEIQAHRGGRGIMPENTLPAFVYALQTGVSVLELDLAVSADGKLVVSHEPYMNHEICTGPAGKEITEANDKSFNLYRMTYKEIAAFDCGLKPHPRFPEQKKMKVSKPLFSQVIDTAEAFGRENKREVFYNIETKCLPAFDSIYHPKPAEFCELIYQLVSEKKIEKRIIIQSFDHRTLQYFRRKYPEIKLAVLEASRTDFQKVIEELGFVPDIYSPAYNLVNKDLVEFCQKNTIRLIPWTVNETDDMRALEKAGVSGIITDYPARAVELFRQK